MIVIRWQDAAYGSAKVGAGLGVIGFIGWFLLLSGMSHTDSGDSFQYACEKGICADAFINITTTYWNVGFEHTSPDQYIYLPEDLSDFRGKLTKYKVSDLNFTPTIYKKATYGRKLWGNLGAIDMIVDTQPDINVEWLVPARGKGNWRPIKAGDSWDRGKINKIKLRATDIPKGTTVKWSFVLGEINIDPYWFPLDNASTIDYEYTYANKTIEVTKYHMVNKSYQVPVYKNESYEIGCNETNITDCYTPCLNMTNYTYCKELNRTVVDHYNTQWHMVNESYQATEQVPDEQCNKVLGVTVISTYYKSKFEGGMCFAEDYLSERLVEPGDINCFEYCRCRPYEILKHACKETYFGEAT